MNGISFIPGEHSFLSKDQQPYMAEIHSEYKLSWISSLEIGDMVTVNGVDGFVVYRNFNTIIEIEIQY